MYPFGLQQVLRSNLGVLVSAPQYLARKGALVEFYVDSCLPRQVIEIHVKPDPKLFFHTLSSPSIFKMVSEVCQLL